MIYVVDNIANYLIYLFIIYFGFRLSPRKNKLFPGASVLLVLLAGAFNAYFDTNSPIVYIFWSMLSISLFFEERLGHLIVLSAALMYFTGIVDTFSVILIQVVLMGGGVIGTDIAWWMEPFLKKPDADLLFLDIELADGEDGFEIAEKLMNSGDQCKICFLTAHTELARLGYRVNAFRYIDKKHPEEISEALDFFS